MHKCVNNTVGNIYHLEQMVDSFFPYSQEKLGFDKPATIVFQSDDDNASRMLGKTAYYNPEAQEVVLYTDNRHPKDIMRSLSHELVHHAQNCRGDFTNSDSTYEGYAQKDPHLRNMEREAYTKGNLIFRDFEDLIKTGKINIEIDLSKSGEPKMSLKEWKNNEINQKLMKKWGLLKEGSKPDFLDLDKDGDKKEPMKSAAKERGDEEGNRPSMAKKMDLDEEQGIFAPNHYCIHHGGVQHEGQIKMGEAVNHNFDRKLNKVTHYDMKLEDGTILESVSAEDIQVTNASLAEGHDHPMRDEDDLDLTGPLGAEGGPIKMRALSGPDDPRLNTNPTPEYAGTKVKPRRGSRSASAVRGAPRENQELPKKISVKEAKQITRRIIERIKKENK